MKKIFISILVLSIFSSSGCLGNRKSALEKFKEKNPIDKMLFSDKSNSNVKKLTRESSGNKKFTENPIDLSELESIPDQPINRLVKVSGEKVPLRKGPGSQYGKLGTGKKDQTFPRNNPLRHQSKTERYGKRPTTNQNGVCHTKHLQIAAGRSGLDRMMRRAPTNVMS